MTPEWLREDASVRSASAYRVGREVMLGGYTFSRWALDMHLGYRLGDGITIHLAVGQGSNLGVGVSYCIWRHPSRAGNPES